MLPLCYAIGMSQYEKKTSLSCTKFAKKYHCEKNVTCGCSHSKLRYYIVFLPLTFVFKIALGSLSTKKFLAKKSTMET